MRSVGDGFPVPREDDILPYRNVAEYASENSKSPPHPPQAVPLPLHRGRLWDAAKIKKSAGLIGRFLGMAGIFEGAARAAAGAGGLAALLFGKFECQHHGKNSRNNDKYDYCWGIHGFTSGRIRIK